MKMICNKPESCKAPDCNHYKPHNLSADCMLVCTGGSKCVELPPKYAELTLTIEISPDKWNEMKQAGYSTIEIQKELERDLLYKVSRSGLTLIQDVDEFRLRKWR